MCIISKKKRKKEKKEWKRKLWNKVQKRWGSQTIHGKWIIGWLMSTKENDEGKGKEVLWAPHFMRMKVTKPKWPYLCTQPHYKPWKDLFDLEWAETNVYWKIRANLWVKLCSMFFFVSVGIKSDSKALNYETIV